jgi:hypothetical protein
VKPRSKATKARKRPSAPDLARLPSEYAVVVSGDCMLPVFANNATLAVSKIDPPRAGDFVVLYFKPDRIPSGGRSAQIKRLAADVPFFVKSFPHADHPKSEVVAAIIYEMLNPPRRMTVAASDLLGLHKVIGFQKSA